MNRNSQEQIDFAAPDDEYYCNHWREITQQPWPTIGSSAVAVWAMGEENARCVAGLLTVAYDHGLPN